jgi:hypothetical protein
MPVKQSLKESLKEPKGVKRVAEGGGDEKKETTKKSRTNVA